MVNNICKYCGKRTHDIICTPMGKSKSGEYIIRETPNPHTRCFIENKLLEEKEW